MQSAIVYKWRAMFYQTNMTTKLFFTSVTPWIHSNEQPEWASPGNKEHIFQSRNTVDYLKTIETIDSEAIIAIVIDTWICDWCIAGTLTIVIRR